MKQNRKLTELKNIGKKIADRLNEVGIFSENELRKVGSAGAYSMIKERYPEETLPVCHYLYSFEAALEVRKINPEFSLVEFNKIVPQINKSKQQIYINALRKAGLPE